MSTPTTQPADYGLSAAQVEAARNQFGTNQVVAQGSAAGWRLFVEVISEPMFILLAIASFLYVLLGQWEEGIVLGVAMVVVSGISVFQTVRSDRALLALRQLTQPTVSVLRDGQITSIAVADIVVGDVVWLTEGQTVPADGLLLQANDCSVDEATLTGESVPVFKAAPYADRFFAGTLLVSGSAYIQITAIGSSTEMGRLGRSLQVIEAEKTPLQQQISQFVQRMALAGVGAFALVWGINVVRSGDWATSLLLGLTIAMSVLPEEIPVAFSSFMALGAARMIRFGVLTKQPQTVESVGSATVICTDKTGTITQEGMTLATIYDYQTNVLVSPDQTLSASAREVLTYARLASEPEPFDAMERAIVVAYQPIVDETITEPAAITHEYALGGIPPMMTHLYALPEGGMRVAGKGAVERIIRVCRLAEEEATRVRTQADELAKQGYRVLAVAGSLWTGQTVPEEQDDFDWSFKGLVALENPPKSNAREVIRQFDQAGIKVKMITGDSAETAQAIARQVAMPNADRILTGQAVMRLSDEQLQQEVGAVNVYARMFPEAKLRVIRALKAIGEVVAMTGDGVNDGPALKAAHIGVAMGKRGTEVAKQAASLVLVNDDLSGMVDAIAQGRLIYQNLKRAIGYIVSIHIPIILTVAVPLLLSWRYVNIFSPIHVIFLELVMGPTCSIAFENEPAEQNLMSQKPRPLSDTFFTWRELSFRILQGIAIASVTLGVYAYTARAGYALEHVRTMTFVTLVLSNVWLTLVSRSDRELITKTVRRANSLLWFMLGLTLLMLMIFLYVPAARQLAQFDELTANELIRCMGLSLLGVFWIEIYKIWKRQTRYNKTSR